MDGIQKSVYLGLIAMAEKVKAGLYGEGDDAFHGDEDEDGLQFLSDMCDDVTGKMQ